MLENNEDEADRAIMTEFTLFNICGCGQLNFKNVKPEDCSRCGTGRRDIEMIIEDILIRQVIKEAKLIIPLCKVCGKYH